MLLDAMTYPGGASVLLWRLDEDAPQLLALCRESGIQVEDLLDVPPKRQREQAATRLLLRQAFGLPVTLSHTPKGAPCVDGIDVNVSITHTPQLVALAWSEDGAVGVDAEAIDRRQVLRVRHKFLNAGEQRFIDADDLVAHIIAWTAKEAVIKATRDNTINWTDGICLEPFTVGDSCTGMVAHCNGKCYDLTSRLLAGHCVTLAMPHVG